MAGHAMSLIVPVQKSDIFRLKAPKKIWSSRFTCVKNQTTTQDIAIPDDFVLERVEFWFSALHIAASNYYSAYLYDVDNVSGNGAGPLVKFADQVSQRPDNVHEYDFEIMIAMAVNGLYFRVEYENDSLLNDVSAFLNFHGYDLSNTGV